MNLHIANCNLTCKAINHIVIISWWTGNVTCVSRKPCSIQLDQFILFPILYEPMKIVKSDFIFKDINSILTSHFGIDVVSSYNRIMFILK